MDTKMIARNARKHYSAKAGIPVWNPSLAAYYVLRLVAGKPRFLVPTLRTWAILATQGKRKQATTLYRGLRLYATPQGGAWDNTCKPRYMVA
jgi:hypothetical protein